MKTRQHFVEEYHARMEEEKLLWEMVEGKGPGQPGFKRELWEAWLQAVAATTAASKAMREAFADDTKPGGLH